MQRLIGRVNYVQHPDRQNKPLSLQSESRFAVVTVRLKDGRTLSEYQGAENRKVLVEEEVHNKFRQNAEIGGLAAKQVERTLELMGQLETVQDVSSLVDMITKAN